MKTYTTDALPHRLTTFLQDYSRVYRAALVEAVNRRLAGETDKTKLNAHLQQAHGINKRQANAVITEADGMIAGAKECRSNHLKELEGRLKAAQDWVKKRAKQLKDSRKFYHSKSWQSKSTTPHLKLACSLDSKRNTWQSVRFALHHKRRYIVHLERQLAVLKVAPLRVVVSRNLQAFFVGSKGETWGNQVCQWDGATLKLRVPQCLEGRYGEYIECPINPLPYGHEKLVEALNTTGVSVGKNGETPIRHGLAMTYRFYAKAYRWFMAVSFEVPAPKQVTRPRQYGAIGLDLNVKRVDWSYIDQDGNLKAHGQFPLHLSGKRRGQAKAIVADVVSQIATLAQVYQCPIVVESLDFSRKKMGLRERGRKYARMLSGFIYSRFNEVLANRCFNLGIELIQVNPAYSSLIGLVKYSRLYGLSSDEAAALVLARRAMRLSERLSPTITAFLGVNPSKHVWSGWAQLNKKLRGVSRHSYYSISNWESMVKPDDELEQSSRLSGKRQQYG